METQEGNELIAKYDGWQWESEEWDAMYKVSEGFWYSDNSLYEDISLDEAEYHSNWNWLIPVVKKVLEQLKAREGTNNVYMGFMAIADIEKKLLELDIEPLWQTTVKAIQLINKYKKDADK